VAPRHVVHAAWEPRSALRRPDGRTMSGPRPGDHVLPRAVSVPFGGDGVDVVRPGRLIRDADWRRRGDR